MYPELVRVPGYPVYYAPRLSANFFFYDGLYWVYRDDSWYASSWYNGPWGPVGREAVPPFVLRVPVRYYRQPPSYFQGWRPDAPPRWGEHWGHEWERSRSGWDRWNRRSVPAPAPLPVYQRGYSGQRYPQQVEQQHEVRDRNYRYQPREPIVRQHFQKQAPQQRPGAAPRTAPQPRPEGTSRPARERQQEASPRSAPQPQGGAAQREQQQSREQDRRPAQRGEGPSQDSGRDQGKGRGGGDRGKGDGRDKDRGG